MSAATTPIPATPSKTPRCGSTSFRADRSLGGRLVCSHCGTPVDQRGGRVRRAEMTPGKKGLAFWLVVAAIALLLVIVIQSL